jgi:Spy/CpxP family protein refolding chaperone
VNLGRLLAGPAIALFLGATVARAQPVPPGDHTQQRDEAFRMVDAYIVANLQESLGLSDQKYAEVIPLVKNLQRERRDYFEARWHAQRELRRLLRSGGATEADVAAALGKLRQIETSGPEKTRRALDALDGALTPLQQAKYRVFELDVEQRLRELMRRARRHRESAQP